jgi:CheY-like chemotaxis protein
LSSPDDGNEQALDGVKVLVVDDEPDARELIRRLLADCSADVVTAASAREALDLMASAHPDVLVSDIGMPGDDGYELIRRVRMRGDRVSRLPAIALTAMSRLQDRTQALLAGYQIHLAKPVDARELLVTVATLARRPA